MVDGDRAKNEVVVADRREHPAGLQQVGEIDLVNGAISERQTRPAPLSGSTAVIVVRAFTAVARSAVGARESGRVPSRRELVAMERRPFSHYAQSPIGSAPRKIAPVTITTSSPPYTA